MTEVHDAVAYSRETVNQNQQSRHGRDHQSVDKVVLTFLLIEGPSSKALDEASFK